MQREQTGAVDGRFGAESRKVLLVDDDAPLRRNLARAFERDGFEVATAASLKEAYHVAADFCPDFALLDLNLRDGYGMTLVSTLRELRPGVRIVILTGYDSIASSLVALKAGAVGYLAKPVQTEKVVATLTTAPSRPSSRCRRTVCAESTSSASSSNAIATSWRPPAASACTGARWIGSSRSARRGNDAPRTDCAEQANLVQG